MAHTLPAAPPDKTLAPPLGGHFTVHDIEHVTAYAATDGIVLASRDLHALTPDGARTLAALLPQLAAEHEALHRKATS